MLQLICPCGEIATANTTQFRCHICHEPFDVSQALPAVTRDLFDQRLGRANAPYDSGVWRFKELIYPDAPTDQIVSKQEGNTPIYRSRHVQEWTGVSQLGLKHEGMNPTGSFKDRGMTVAVTQAKLQGATRVVCASTGNTSAAVAAYAAEAGMQAVILVPEAATAMGKLTQALAYGARTVMIKGNFDDAMGMVQQASNELGLYLLNSLNPFRIEGQKAIMLEMLQQLNWESPDWVVCPAGNLGNTSAFGKALVEAKDAGLIDRLPRLLAVQAEGASPFEVAYRQDFAHLIPMKPETLATAIRIGNPVSYSRAIKSITATDGVVSSVDDQAIMEAKAIVDAAGIGAEPGSCASVAGVKQAVDIGLIKPTDRVVAILTGHLLKDSKTTLRYHQGELGGKHPNPPVVINPNLGELATAIGA